MNQKKLREGSLDGQQGCRILDPSLLSKTAGAGSRPARISDFPTPENARLIVCDDTASTLLTQAWSTVQEFPEQFGKQLVELALSWTMKPVWELQTATIPTEFVDRDSCAPPAGPGN
jgi:hypothetical protein